jgi:hypothetical protein
LQIKRPQSICCAALRNVADELANTGDRYA